MGDKNITKPEKGMAVYRDRGSKLSSHLHVFTPVSLGIMVEFSFRDYGTMGVMKATLCGSDVLAQMIF
jgi:hypothetical protein